MSDDEIVEEKGTITAEQLLEIARRAETVAADRLVILRSMEGFFNTIDQARTRLLQDIQEINNSIAIRDGPLAADAVAEEE